MDFSDDKLFSTVKSIAQSVAHIQIFLQVQVGQVDLCPPLTLEVQVGLCDQSVQAVPFDLLDLSALVPLLTLSGKNTTLVLVIHTTIQDGGTVTNSFS